MQSRHWRLPFSGRQHGQSFPKVNNLFIVNLCPAVSLHSVSPNVAVRFDSIPAPLEFSVRYGLPILGKNTLAAHALTLGVAVYF
jgi:hypothetical protein